MSDTIFQNRRIKCPRCGCKELQTVNITETVRVEGSRYSATNGCLGYLLFGPLGLLCGTCGCSVGKTGSDSSKLFWVCSHCGNKFRNLDDLRAEISACETKLTVVRGLAIFVWIMCFLLAVILIVSHAQGGLCSFFWFFIIVCALAGVIMLIGVKGQVNQLENEYETLYTSSMD